MSLCSIDHRAPALRLCAAALLLSLGLVGQTPAPGAAQPPAPSITQTPAPSTTQPPAPAPTASGKKPAVPDYPDPRTVTVGVFYWLAIPGSGPDVIGGRSATVYSTLDHLGKEHFAPDVQVSIPITRTGEIKFEGFLAKGTGSQIDAVNTGVFATGFTKGEYLSTQYQITSGKVYLDDLLYPFKYPVSKFRLKSLWEFQYIAINGTVDGPLAPNTDTAGNLLSHTGTGSRNILFPTFGLAAEYAIRPHVLLRADASGFGLYHRADLWDANATVSYRRNKLEFRAGYKVLHFKTSPQKDEYFTDTLSGGFVGVLYHWQ